MTENNTSEFIDLKSSLHGVDYLPVRKDIPLVDAVELQVYKKGLRQYFLHEKRITEHTSEEVYPLLTAPFLRGESVDLPVLYIQSEDTFINLRPFLQRTMEAVFTENESNTLANLQKDLLDHVHQNLDKKVIGYEELVRMIMEFLRTTDGREADFPDQCAVLEKLLLSTEAMVLGNPNLIAFQILNLNLKKTNDQSASFISRMKSCIAGIDNLLLLHGKGKSPEDQHFGFADKMMAFDKIAALEPQALSSELSESRLNRISESRDILTDTLDAYQAQSNIVFVNQDLVKTFNLKSILTKAELEITSERSCSAARSHLQKEIQRFVDTTAAIKLAELEIDQKYEEEMHSPYFEKFNISFLGDEDLKFFRPVIVIEYAHELMQSTQDMLALLASDAHVKVLSVNRLDHINKTIEGLDQDTQLELASLAIIRRNAFIFQGGSDTPELLHNVINRSLNDTLPALWNILIPGNDGDRSTKMVSLRSAIESRYFPRFVYDIRSGEEFSSHFDLTPNPQHEKIFPVYGLEIVSASDKKTSDFEMTTADFLATVPEERIRLLPIPASYADESIIPLMEYLNTPSGSVATRLPFIWVVNSENEMIKALVPLSWVQRCRSRIDYWQFLQEVGGTKNSQVGLVLDEEKAEWEKLKEEEIETVRAQLHADFDRTRSLDLERAIKKILHALVDPDKVVSIPNVESPAPNIAVVPEEPGEVPAEKVTESTEPVEKEATTINPEAWIETDECTSCSDCTDALPGVFKYNSDKQAIIHNPKGGSYAKIVACAEKCPAACIHPGLPHNQDEPNLEKLIKRAEKFN